VRTDAAALKACCLTRAIVGHAQDGLADCDKSLKPKVGKVQKG
jgi:hypothetical protein